nr:hypothetical protein [Nanoarchaeum sp.]
MKSWNFLWIILIIAIWIVAYSIVNDPYNQAKRDKTFLGDKDAEVTIIAFIDYSNENSSISEESMKSIRETYKDKIKFIYKFYNYSDLSFQLAMAAECAASQQKFERMHNLLFENYYNISNVNIYSFATQIYLRQDEFRICMDKQIYGQSISSDYKIAERLKIKTIPTVFINGQRIEGLNNLSVYSEIIDSEL